MEHSDIMAHHNESQSDTMDSTRILEDYIQEILRIEEKKVFQQKNETTLLAINTVNPDQKNEGNSHQLLKELLDTEQTYVECLEQVKRR